MGDIGDIIYSIAGEVDLLFAVGPFVYVKEKLSDLVWSIDNALSEDDNSTTDDDSKDTSEDSIADAEDDDTLTDEARDFIKDHMEELQEITVRAIKQISPSEYKDQQEYLKDVFDHVGDACWSYIHDIFDDPEISSKLSDKITEKMIKDTAVVAASTMFIEWALDQKKQSKDEDAVKNEENKEVETK